MLLSMNERERFRLAKRERICGEKRIESLFANGSSFMAYPFRVVWLKRDAASATMVSVLISIPKKRLKRAVDRNRMKRVAREAYRLHKNQLINQLTADNLHLDVVFIYVRDEPSDFVTTEKGIVKAFRELARINQTAAT